MSSEENKCEQQSTLFSCSLCSQSCIRMPVSERPGNIKLSSSEPGRNITAIRDSVEICQTCKINFITPKPVALYAEPCECEDETLPSPTASEQDICEPCDTPGCKPNSRGVEPTYEDSDPCPVSCTGACSSEKQPLYIDPCLKYHTPNSIEELKASITGLTSSNKCRVENLIECDNIEFCYEVHSSQSDCEPEKSKPMRQGFSLTKEPNDHRFCTNPDTCKHSRESCEPSLSEELSCAPEEPPCPPEEPPCPPEEPPCPPKKPPCPPKKPPCPPEEPPCPPEKPPCPPRKPPCPPKEPPCPPEEPPCPPEEPECPPEEPPCPPEEPPCPPEEPPCPPEEPPCPPEKPPCPPEKPRCPPKKPSCVQFAAQ